MDLGNILSRLTGRNTYKKKNRRRLKKKTTMMGEPRPSSINERITHFNQMIQNGQMKRQQAKTQLQNQLNQRIINPRTVQEYQKIIRQLDEIIEKTKHARDSLILWRKGYSPKDVWEMKQKGENPLELIRNDKERYMGV